jgi:hypothetical protein
MTNNIMSEKNSVEFLQHLKAAGDIEKLPKIVILVLPLCFLAAEPFGHEKF